MKIVVISGDDVLSSRDRYFKIISALNKRGWEHVALDASKKISEQLVSTSLFDIERIYSIDKPLKVVSTEYEWLSAHADEFLGSLLIYFEKAVPASLKKLLPKSTKYEEFKLPQKLFLFLENIFPNNKNTSIKLLHELLKTNPPELILAMMARHLKDLYTLKVSPNSNSLPEWRARKLQNQLNKFKGSSLEDFIESLSDLDLKSKTGEGDIKVLLDLTLVKL